MSTDDCIFCRIIAGELPSTVVRENDAAFAFRDLHPQAPTHVLVVPRAHHADVATLVAADPALCAEVFRLATEVAEQEQLTGGYRLVANTGPDSGQTVFHAHVHVLGGGPMGVLG